MSDKVRRALALAESILGPAKLAGKLDEMNIFDPETWDFQGANDRLKKAFKAVDWIAIATDMVKKGKLDLTAFLSMPAWIEKTKLGSQAEKLGWWKEAVRLYQGEVKSGKAPLFDERKKVGGFGFHYQRACSLWKEVRAAALPGTRDIRRDDEGKVTYKEAEDAFIKIIQKASAAVMRAAKDNKESVEEAIGTNASPLDVMFSLCCAMGEAAVTYTGSSDPVDYDEE